MACVLINTSAHLSFAKSGSFIYWNWLPLYIDIIVNASWNSAQDVMDGNIVSSENSSRSVETWEISYWSFAPIGVEIDDILIYRSTTNLWTCKMEGEMCSAFGHEVQGAHFFWGPVPSAAVPNFLPDIMPTSSLALLGNGALRFFCTPSCAKEAVAVHSSINTARRTLGCQHCGEGY